LLHGRARFFPCSAARTHESNEGFPLAAAGWLRSVFEIRQDFFQEDIFQEEPMPFHFSDFATAANLLVLLGIYRKMSIIVYQHKLMWSDFAERKGISANGKHAAGV
jgi:hypothetical protein